MKGDGLELPIEYRKIVGPGVDALENRKECGSPIDLEGTIQLPPRSFFKRLSKAIARLQDYVNPQGQEKR